MIIKASSSFWQAFKFQVRLFRDKNCKVDPSNDEARFKVKFNVVPVPGNYWVLYVDDDYQYALLGEPTRTSLFILSKKIEIDENVYNYIVQIAEEEGYDANGCGYGGDQQCVEFQYLLLILHLRLLSMAIWVFKSHQNEDAFIRIWGCDSGGRVNRRMTFDRVRDRRWK